MLILLFFPFFPVLVGACFFSLILALVLPNLSTVFGLTGSVCAFPYCFMFPCLFYLRLHQPGAAIQFMRGAAPNKQSEEATPTGQTIEQTSNERTSKRAYMPLNKDDDGASVSASGSRSPSSSSRPSVVSVVDVPRMSGGRAYHSLSTDSSALSHASPLLATQALPRSKKIPAYTLLVVSSVLWIIAIVVSFRTMIDDFNTTT